MKKIDKVSLIMPYYDNAGMLAEHYAHWVKFPDEIKRRMEVIIVDDGTPTTAAGEVPRPEKGLPPLKIFRVAVDLPWHQHACRNIGAHEARKSWLFLTDMDHLIPEETWRNIFKLDAEPPHTVYTHLRVDAPDMQPKIKNGQEHPHPNTFLMSKEFYWMIGGYDEDFCGVYGTDGMFRKRLWAVARHKPLRDPIIRYDREVLADASTRTLQRKEGRDPEAKPRIEKMKREKGTLGKPSVLTLPYQCVFKRDPYRIPRPQDKG